MKTFVKADELGNLVELTQSLTDLPGWILVDNQVRIESYYLDSQAQIRAYTQEQLAARNQPQLIGYRWNPGTMAWQLATDSIKTQLAWETVRQQRDQLLKDTDWIEIRALDPNLELPTTAWRQYRQQLRDITQQANPYSVVWPVKPSV